MEAPAKYGGEQRISLSAIENDRMRIGSASRSKRGGGTVVEKKCAFNIVALREAERAVSSSFAAEES